MDRLILTLTKFPDRGSGSRSADILNVDIGLTEKVLLGIPQKLDVSAKNESRFKMDVYGEFPGQKLFVDGDLLTAIIYICETQPECRKGIIIFKYRLDDLLTRGSTPF